MRKAFLKKGASVLATAALVGCMVPAIAFADATVSGTGTETKTTDDISVSYEKECSWTVSYPTSVSLIANGDTASASIGFTVTGLVDIDHQVTITLSQFKSVKSDPTQTTNLSAYASTGKLKISGILAGESDSTVTSRLHSSQR